MLVGDSDHAGPAGQPALPSLGLQAPQQPGTLSAAASEVLSTALAPGSPPSVLTSHPTPPSPRAFPVLLCAALKPLPLARFPKTLLVVIRPTPPAERQGPLVGMPGIGTSQDGPEGDSSLCPLHLLLEAAFLTCYDDSFGVKVHLPSRFLLSHPLHHSTPQSFPAPGN